MPDSSYIRDVSESTFESEVIDISSQVPVVVDFWAPWCGPCRILGPLLEKLAVEGQGAFVLAKVNVDANPALAARYHVQGIPAVKAFRHGRVASEFTGAQPEVRVREFIKKLAPSAADRALSEALSLLAVRHWAGAEAAARAVLDSNPASGPGALALAKALLAQGKGCEAEAILAGFPPGDSVLEAEKMAPLASLLCTVESADAPLDDSELDAQYYQSARLLARGQIEAGLDGLLDVLRQDKRYRKGEPRRVILAVFELIGDEDTVRAYRGELASVLF